MVDFRVEGIASINPDQIIEDIDLIIDKMDEAIDAAERFDATLDSISNKSLVVDVEINGKDKLDELMAILDRIEGDHTLLIDVVINGADDAITKLDEIDLKVKDKIEEITVNVSGADEAIAKLEGVKKAVDDVDKSQKDATSSGEGFKFSILQLLPLLTAAIPAALALGSGIIGLVGAFAMVVPGLIGVYAALDPVIKGLSTFQSGLAASTVTAVEAQKSYTGVYNILQKQSAAFDALSPSMKAVTVNYELLRNAYQRFQTAVDPTVLPLLSSGMSLLEEILKAMPPVVDKAAIALEGLITNFGKRLQDPTFHTFFTDMEKNIGTFVTDWGTGILNILEGLAALFSAFMPISMDISGGFLEMTKSFETWAQGLAKSKGFQQFVAYVEKEGPVVLNIVGQLVVLIGRLVGALMGMGGTSLSVIDKVLQDLNKFAEQNPEVFKLAVNLGLVGVAASKLAPALGPIIEFISSPVGLAVIAIAALAAAFYLAYTKSSQFRDYVNKNLVPELKGLLKDVEDVKTWFIGIWPDIVKAWDLYGQRILDNIVIALQTIIGVIEGALKIIEGIIEIFVGLATGKWSLVWDGIKKITSGAWQVIESIVVGAAKILENDLANFGTFIEQILGKTFMNSLKSTGTFFANMASAFGNGLVTLSVFFYNLPVTALNALVSGFSRVYLFFINLPNQIRSLMGNFGDVLWAAGYNLIGGLINGIEAALGPLINLLNWITSHIPSWKGPASTDADLLYDNGTLVIQGFIDGMESKYSAVENSLGKLTKTVGNTFGNQFSTSISAQLEASMGNSTFQVNSSGSMVGGGAKSITFAAGAIQVNSPTTPEAPSQTISRTMQAISRFGLLQAPMAMSEG